MKEFVIYNDLSNQSLSRIRDQLYKGQVRVGSPMPLPFIAFVMSAKEIGCSGSEISRMSGLSYNTVSKILVSALALSLA